MGVEGQQRRDAAHIIAHRPRLARRLQREQPRYEGLQSHTKCLILRPSRPPP